MYKNNFFKDIYTKNDKLQFENEIKLKLSQSPNTQEHYGLLKLCLTNFVLGDEGISFTINKDDSIKSDGYILVVGYENQIKISYSTRRSLKYALIGLNDLVEKKDNSLVLPIVLIEDSPSFEIRGVIEGFYGKPYSFDERCDLINTLEKWRMNAYFYAPKDDPYHRDKWREPYPENELNELIMLIKKCLHKDIDFYFCISPGKDFTFTEEADYEALIDKVRQVMYAGVRHFCLLLDDIDYKLKSEDEAIYKTPGFAHANVVNRINEFTKRHYCKLIMCPTEYIQTWDTPYRKDLRENLDKDVAVFWTGYNTVAEVITDKDGKNVREVFQRDLVLWDNYPVNDFEPKRRIYLGPLKNRSVNLCETHIGMISNPMISWHLSKIAVRTMAEFMWNSGSYQPEIAWDNAISDLFEKKYRKAVKTFAQLNASSIMQKEDDYLKQWYLEKNYGELDNHYKEALKAIDTLKNCTYTEFVEQAKPYFDYTEMEAELFEQIKSGKIPTDLVFLLQNFAVRTSNQYILEHIKDFKLIEQWDKIELDKERERFFKI